MPTISIIVPVYKVEPYLRRCVDSILGQTFADFELILVDDGSPDNCPAICDEYAAKDSRVVVIHQENGGLSAARNAGIDWAFTNSDSQWLTFIDSDDWVHLEYMEQLLNAAVKYDVAVSICGFAETAGEVPEVHLDSLIPAVWIPEIFYVERNVNATIACGKLYKKECFDEIRYPVGKIHEDEFVTYQLLFKASRVAMIEAPLYAYYKNNEGITKSDWSSKRLHSIEAIEAQVIYLKKHGFRKGYYRAVKKYAFNLADHIMALKRCDVCEQRKYTPLLRHKLIMVLILHRKIFSFEQFHWIYDLAFPCVMDIYWFGNSLLKKMAGRR